MKLKLLLVTLLILLSVGVVPLTQADTLSQSQASITTFETSAEGVPRAALSTNTARIPVTWEVAQRPPNSNLVFEQVFPDGRVQNVELPRNFSIVSSSGTGVVAPTISGEDAIRIQVRLIDLNSNAAFAQREFTLPITDDPVTGGSIESFTAGRTSVSQSELSAGVLIPVSWQAVALPPQSNLVFEQILANGTVVNVELPRNFLLVPPQGEGIVAPRLPGGDSDEVVLRLSAVDLLPTPRVESGVFDQQEVTLEVTDEPVSVDVQIDTFSSTVVSISRADLAAGGLRIPVAWNVRNRPPNSNLYFEQILANGGAQNIELPRNFLIIPSSGSGTVSPLAPPANVNEIRVRLRVSVLNSDQSLASSEITFAVTGTQPAATEEASATAVATEEPVTSVNVARGAVCLRRPYRPSNGIGGAQTGTVSANTSVNILDQPAGGSVIGSIASGASFTMVDASPACYQTDVASNNQPEFRLWRVRSDSNVEGWVNEYAADLAGIRYLIEPAGDGGTTSADACLASPYPTDQGISVGGHVEVTQGAPANGIPFVQVNSSGAVVEEGEYDALRPGGTLIVIGGPVCRNEGDTTYGPIRQWLVQSPSGVLEGWVYEHTNVPGNTVQYLTPAK